MSRGPGRIERAIRDLRASVDALTVEQILADVRAVVIEAAKNDDLRAALLAEMEDRKLACVDP